MIFPQLELNKKTIELYDYQKKMLEWFKDESIKKFTLMPIRMSGKRIKPKGEG